MSAKEMFEKLGFKIYKDYRFKTDNDLIAYTDDDTYIYFYKNKIIEFRNDAGVDYAIFKAINKQIEELGWNNE